MTLGTLIVAVLGAFTLFALVNMRAFKRLLSSGQAQLGKVGRWAEGKDPLAMYQEKIDEAVDHLRHLKDGLVRVKGLIASVERQVKDGDRDVARLDARIKMALNDGNETRATDLVTQMQTVNKNLTENKKQLAQHNDSYAGLLKQVQSAQERVLQAKRDAEQLGAQLDISKGQAEVADILGKFQPLGKGSPLEDLSKYRAEVENRIDQNRARGQVASELDTSRLAEEAEDDKVKKLEAKAMLDEYKSKVKSNANGPAVSK